MYVNFEWTQKRRMIQENEACPHGQQSLPGAEGTLGNLVLTSHLFYHLSVVVKNVPAKWSVLFWGVTGLQAKVFLQEFSLSAN